MLSASLGITAELLPLCRTSVQICSSQSSCQSCYLHQLSAWNGTSCGNCSMRLSFWQVCSTPSLSHPHVTPDMYERASLMHALQYLLRVSICWRQYVPILLACNWLCDTRHTAVSWAVLMETCVAGPGVLLGGFLTALLVRYTFPYHWSWLQCLLFGSVLSATDPVAVAAVLSEVRPL